MSLSSFSQTASFSLFFFFFLSLSLSSHLLFLPFLSLGVPPTTEKVTPNPQQRPTTIETTTLSLSFNFYFVGGFGFFFFVFFFFSVLGFEIGWRIPMIVAISLVVVDLLLVTMGLLWVFG